MVWSWLCLALLLWLCLQAMKVEDVFFFDFTIIKCRWQINGLHSSRGPFLPTAALWARNNLSELMYLRILDSESESGRRAVGSSYTFLVCFSFFLNPVFSVYATFKILLTACSLYWISLSLSLSLSVCVCVCLSLCVCLSHSTHFIRCDWIRNSNLNWAALTGNRTKNKRGGGGGGGGDRGLWYGTVRYASYFSLTDAMLIMFVTFMTPIIFWMKDVSPASLRFQTAERLLIAL